MQVLLMTIVFVAIAMAFLAIGYIVRGKCIRGTCGGEAVETPGGEVTCGTCGREKSPDEVCDTHDAGHPPSHEPTAT